MKNLDSNRLEATGKLIISSLVVDELSGIETTGTVSWSSLISSLQEHSEKKVAVLVDDVDALELIAPTSVAARTLFSSLLLEMYNNVSRSDSHMGC